MGGLAVPEKVKRIVSLAFTVGAAILYGILLGLAIVQTFTGQSAQFSGNMARAIGLLSGLVGSVVTAGFARSEPVGVARGDGPLGDRAPNGRVPKRPSLLRRNLASLANTLGLTPFEEPGRAPVPGPGGEVDDYPQTSSAPVWVALLYFAVYFVVGVAAFLTALLRPASPEIVTNAGWVWLGTAISSAYSFLGLNARR